MARKISRFTALALALCMLPALSAATYMESGDLLSMRMLVTVLEGQRESDLPSVSCTAVGEAKIQISVKPAVHAEIMTYKPLELIQSAEHMLVEGNVNIQNLQEGTTGEESLPGVGDGAGTRSLTGEEKDQAAGLLDRAAGLLQEAAGADDDDEGDEGDDSLNGGEDTAAGTGMVLVACIGGNNVALIDAPSDISVGGDLAILALGEGAAGSSVDVKEGVCVSTLIIDGEDIAVQGSGTVGNLILSENADDPEDTAGGGEENPEQKTYNITETGNAYKKTRIYVSPEGAGTAAMSSGRLTATPAKGYVFVGWTIRKTDKLGSISEQDITDLAAKGRKKKHAALVSNPAKISKLKKAKSQFKKAGKSNKYAIIAVFVTQEDWYRLPGLHTHIPGDTAVVNEIPATTASGGQYTVIQYCGDPACGQQIDINTYYTDPLPLPETPKDPCANGHTGGKADCLHPAVCSVCGKSYGTLGDHVPGEPEVLLENDETMFTVIRCTVCGEILSKDPVEPEDEPGEDP